jgi:predicted P-loop ATPase
VVRVLFTTFSPVVMIMADIISISSGADANGRSADDHARDETGRKRALFAWADAVLKRLGWFDRIARASPEELHHIIFDPNAAEVVLEIRDALHPASGERDSCFAGLREGGLKRVLQGRFSEAKRDHASRRSQHHGGPPDWTAKIKRDRTGKILPTVANILLFLRNHEAWQGVLAYDEFAGRVVFRGAPPWGAVPPDTTWDDHCENRARVWFQQEQGIAAARGDVWAAAQIVARDQTFHPVRDYLEGLVWDGRRRLDAWLSTYLHAENTEYTRAVGPRALIAAVARVFEPGCKADYLLVLEGPQGRQKSEALRTLAVREEWFTDRLSPVATKDAALETAGVWLIEIAEMEALTKSSSGAKKAYLTRRFDRFRPPYGKHAVRVARQCVFFGTINPGVGGYLTDATGARRFWPVACKGTIDRDALERDRDQLWAEAVARYKSGAPWWLETPALESLATIEQKERCCIDVWTETVEKWIANRVDVSVPEVLEGALHIKPLDPGAHAAEIRVAKSLTYLEFTQYRPNRKGRGRGRRYYRQP